MDNLNNAKLTKIINDMISGICENKDIFKKIMEKDSKIHKFNFDINQLKEVLNPYKQRKIKDVKAKKVIVSHYGNPYISAMLCMEAIINHLEMTIAIEDFCYGLNQAIIKIFNDILKMYKIPMKVILENNLTNVDFEQKEEEEILCLGNSNTYMNLRDLKNKMVKYFSLFNINLYYDCEEYIELAENIQEYATYNFYEMQIFDDEEFEDIIYSINHDVNQYCSVLLSKDQDKQNKFKQQINSKIICINENPFKQFKLEIPNEIFNV